MISGIIRRRNVTNITSLLLVPREPQTCIKILSRVGEESETPRDAPVIDFMEWLANELATVSNYMTVGREFASFVSLHAFAQALEECSCDHLEKFKIKDPQTYWNAPRRQRFFEGFWRPGGRDLALLRAAMSHGKVCLYFKIFLLLLLPFCDVLPT